MSKNERIRKLIDNYWKGSHIEYFNSNDELSYHVDGEKPIIVRNAEAIKLVFEKIPLKILDNELIVGIRPEVNFPIFATKRERELSKQIWGLEYNTYFGHTVPNFSEVVNKGFSGVKKDIENRLKSKEPGDIDFLQAAIMLCDSVNDYSIRYSKKAYEMAELEKDIKRKEELKKIGDNLAKVPFNPASNFWECLQSIWLTYSILRISGQPLIGFGRFDQYAYPFFKKDIEEGRYSKEFLTEVLESFFIKLNTADFSQSDFKPFNKKQEIVNDQDTGKNMILGGIGGNNNDQTNELSYICIDTAMKVKLPVPYIQVRLNKYSPDDFILKSCELAKIGIGMPLFNNDDIVIPALKAIGVKSEDAIGYSNVGCNEILIAGKSEFQPLAIWIELLKCLELALNNGISFYRGDRDPYSTKLFKDSYDIDLMTGDEIGANTGDVDTFDSFEILFSAFKTQVSNAIDKRVRKNNATLEGLSKIAPCPLLSIFINDCIAKGKDKTSGGARYNYCTVMGRGLPNVVNALLSIKILVFETEELSLKEFTEILKFDYEENELLREKIVNTLPKYGDDDDEVVNITKRVAEFFCEEVLKFEVFKPFKASYIPSIWAPWYIHTGKQIGASADGRLAGKPIAKNLEPPINLNSKGLTAILNCISSIDQKKAPGCATLDIDIDLKHFKGINGSKILAGLVKTYFKQGGQQIIINIIDPEVLKKAQADPENYKNIIVRVWGYSAYFVHLEKHYQDMIINRYIKQ